uniref:GTP-binding protein 1 n=1 Tax=Hirondellea gigas TaxID=1518452 RepID=A0A2P2IDC5_9CRUS
MVDLPPNPDVKMSEAKHVDLSRGPTDVRIAVIGNVDSGKSTMIGILTSGVLDDGRGSARSRIFRHNHERENGRTSCASQHIMGFDSQLQPVHQPVSGSASAKQTTRAWQAVLKQSDSIITFIDLAGHEKYLKTTIGGLTGCFPDFAMIICGANMGASKMTKEHLAVATALDIPVFVVVTKVDMCPEEVLRHTLKQLFKMLRSPVCGKMPKIMKKKKDCLSILEVDPSLQRLCPVFLVSAVTGINMDKLNLFMSRLRSTTLWDPPTDDSKEEIDVDLHFGHGETVFEIDETFAVRGVGVVLSGTVTSGKMSVNQAMCLGPFSDGSFKYLLIRSVHAKRRPVEDAIAGESCSVSVRFKNVREKVDRAHIRRGMVLVDEAHVPLPVTVFTAQVLVLHHPTTIKCNYEPVLHCGNIRQTVIIEDMTEDALRSGDSAIITFRFKCRPEFLHKGRTLILREGNTKCLGKVLEIVR